jgi:hypothetical protein
LTAVFERREAGSPVRSARLSLKPGIVASTRRPPVMASTSGCESIASPSVFGTESALFSSDR